MVAGQAGMRRQASAQRAMHATRYFEYCPSWVLQDDTLIGFDLAFTQGLSLTGIEPMALPDEALEQLSGRVSALLSSVPAGAVLRFYSVETGGCDKLLESYLEQFPAGSLGEYMALKKIDQWTGGGGTARQRELSCFVSTHRDLPVHRYAPQAFGRNPAKIQSRAEALHRDKLAEVSRLRAQLARDLGALGVGARWLQADELFTTLWRLSNPVLAARRPPPTYAAECSLRSQLIGSGVHNLIDHFWRDGVLQRVITVRLPPRYVQPLQILELATLPFAHMLTVTLKRLGDDEAQRRVEAARRQGHEWNRLLAKVRGAQRNSELPDHHVLQEQGDADDVLARLAGGETLYDVAVHVWLCGCNQEELAQRTDIALGRFRACGHADGGIEELHPHIAFLGMLPGHQALVEDRDFAMLASRAADMVPLFQAWPGAERPTAILSTRGQELVGFEPFSKELQAWNATVAGGTGSGKSFTTRTLLCGWVARGGRVVIATRGGDYHRFAQVLGGVVCDVSADDPSLALSPFLSREDVAQAETAIEQLASILAMMVQEPGAPQGRRERRLIHRATRELYAPGLRGTPCFSDWVGALESVAKDEPGGTGEASRIVSQLRFWLEGPFGRALQRCPQHEDVAGAGGGKAHLAVWNLGSIADADTQGVVLGLLSGVIARSIKAGPTVVIMDEVWALLRSASGAELVETLYRTVRKEGSSIWSISQSMNDYVGLPDGCRSAILNNSPMKIFLAHDASEIGGVAETFKLNEREAHLLASLRLVPGRYSELLLFFGSRRQVLCVKPTATEYWLATSHPRDVEQERALLARRPKASRFQILRELARRFPHGAVDTDVLAA